jgi:hypothetical protein
MHMNFSKMWLVLAAAWVAAANLTAAPIPAGASASQGPLSDALGLREMLPTTAPPVVMKVVMANEDTLEVQHRTFRLETREERAQQVEFVPVERVRTVNRNGVPVTEKYTENVQQTKEIAVKRTVQILDDKIRKESVAAKDCKFFTVTKEGMLEAVEAKKAAPLLKEPTTVLTGAGAEVDPRHLELIKPGTLYVVIPQPKPQPPPPPPPPIPTDKGIG